MRNIVYGQDDVFVPWAESVIGLQFRTDAVSIGLTDKDSKILASVVFDGFSQCDANIHVASDGSRRWLSRDFLASVFAYPFIQCNMNRVTALVPAKNLTALSFDLKLGFQIEGRLHRALPDDDIIIMGMLRQDCRFIPQEHRQ